jgi:hypothetical protein
MTGILLEGVTGAGKSQTLRALKEHGAFSALLGSGRVFHEEETFGELMTELEETGPSRDHHFRRLESILAVLEQDVVDQNPYGFVLERFHLSYYALLPNWNLYSVFDERLAQLDCLTVLLRIPKKDFERRCLDRVDRAGTPWTDDMIQHFGSRPAVIDALDQSIRRRREAAKKSLLPLLEIDTASESWSSYAEQIIAAWRRQVGRNVK